MGRIFSWIVLTPLVLALILFAGLVYAAIASMVMILEALANRFMIRRYGPVNTGAH